MSGTAEDAWLEGETLKAEGDLQGARRQYQEALDVQQRINKIDPTAEAQVPLADLDLEEAHLEHTEPLLRRAITEFEKEKRDPDATGAYTLLSRALMMQGKLE